MVTDIDTAAIRQEYDLGTDADGDWLARIPTRAVRALCDEVDDLRRALDSIRHPDGNTHCPHGKHWDFEDCLDCRVQWADAALGEGEEG